MQKFTRLAVVGAFALLVMASLALPIHAEDDKDWLTKTIGQPLIPEGCTGDQGLSSAQPGKPPDINQYCGLDAVLQVIVNVSRLIVAFAGSAALLMFIYGGTLWIIAAGSPEKIEKGKTAMASAVIGIAIILGAWLIVNFSIAAITEGKIGGDAYIFKNTQLKRLWQQPPTSDTQLDQK